MSTVTVFSEVNRVNTVTTDFQGRPAVASLPGGYVIAWDGKNPSSDSNDIFAQRYDLGGHKVGGQIVVNTGDLNGFQFNPAVTGLATGGFVVTWSTPKLGNDYDIVAQRFTASGKLSGDILTLTADRADTYDSAIAGQADGGFVAAWSGYDETVEQFDVHGQIWNSSGTATGGDWLAPASPSGARSNPAVAVLTNGNFVATFVGEDPAGGGTAIYARRMSVDGHVLGPDFRVAASVYDSTPAITPVADGGYLIAWKHEGIFGADSEIRVQRFAGDGSTVGEPILVAATATDGLADPTIVSLAQGGFVVGWSNYPGGGETADVLSRIYAADGTAIGAPMLATSETLGDQSGASVAGLADGGFVLTWEGFNPLNFTPEVYARTASAPKTLDAMSGAVELVQGTEGDDLIRVGAGGLNLGDQVHGSGGTDTVVLLKPGTLDLRLATLSGIEHVRGTSGDDLIIGSPDDGGPAIDGRSGDDILIGDADGDSEQNGAADTLIGGADDDFIVGDVRGGLTGRDGATITAGDDILQGDGGADRLYGDASGSMTAVRDGAFTLTTVLLGGDDNLRGGTGDDLLVGDAGGLFDADLESEVIGGDDDLDGGSGNDLLIGDAQETMLGRDTDALVRGGADTLHGGSGRDSLVGDAGGNFEALAESAVYGGNDFLDGGDNADQLYGDARGSIFAGSSDGFAAGGNDTLIGGEGDDTLYGDAGLGFQADEAILHSGHDLLEGGPGRDTLYGDAGGDIVTRASGILRRGNDVLDGGDGNDILVGDAGGDILSSDATSLILDGNDVLRGGAGSDLLYGDARGDILLAADVWGGGNDELFGGDGDDALFGDAGGRATVGGNDLLDGGAGKDVLRGGLGADQLTGGSGNDRFLFARGDGGSTVETADVILDFESGSDRIGLVGGLRLADLSLTQSAGDTLIEIASSGEILVTVKNVVDLDAGDFFLA